MLDIIYVEQKLRELHAGGPAMRRDWIEPGSDVQRTGVGRVHEVFRRIVLDAEPARFNRVWRLRPRRA